MVRRLRRFVTRTLRLETYLHAPGDGRQRPRIAADALLWALLVGYLLRDGAFHAVEALVRSRARRALGVRRPFGDDSLGYFTEHLDVGPTRTALVSAARQAKRNKAFDEVLFLGLALDGTTAGRCPTVACPWCHPLIVPRPRTAAAASSPPMGQVIGQHHKLSLLSLVGGDLVFPVDVEPYGPGDSELAASLRLLHRAVPALGRRFAQYLVVDGLYARAPFLHAVGALGLRAVVRLKDNVPTLFADAQARFASRSPTRTFDDGRDHIEVWDADDFDPWEGLPWATVRVLRYVQHHPDGTVVEAYWATDFSAHRVSSRTLYRLAKTRWTIENQGFNDAKTRYGFAHVPHHHATSLLVHWLLVALTLLIERLYRVRYLHRGTAPRLAAIDLLRRLRLSLVSPTPAPDTS